MYGVPAYSGLIVLFVWAIKLGFYVVATSVVLLSIDVLYDSFGVIAEGAKRVYKLGNLLVLNSLLTVLYCNFILGSIISRSALVDYGYIYIRGVLGSTIIILLIIVVTRPQRNATHI